MSSSIGLRRAAARTLALRPMGGRGRLVALVIGVFALIAVAGPARAAAQDDATPEQQLVDRHVPVVMLKAQTAPCDSDGEAYAPWSVEIVLNNPQVFVRQLGTNNPVLNNAPSATDLGDLGEAFYLDFPGDALKPGCTYEEDFDRYSAGTGPTLYAHIVTEPEFPGKLVVQYFFWYYFNNWNNTHESDWEMIQVVFDADTVEQALAAGPVETGFAQHEGGERADWDGDKLQRDGDHPVVYPSAGSHASYYSSAHYLGRGADTGFGCDTTVGPSNTVRPDAVLLPDQVDPTDEEFGWLAFEGHWGERHDGAFNGPTGPATKDQWTEPVTFQNALRDSSVTVPGGGKFGDTAIDAFCGAVAKGSNLLVAVKTTPTRIAIALLILFVLIRSMIRSTTWRPHVGPPLRRRRTVGQILDGAASVYRNHLRAFAWIGLVYVPVGVVTAGAVHLISRLGTVRSLLDLATHNSVVGGAVASLIGGLGNLIAFVIVSAAVAGMLGAADAGRVAAIGAYKRTARQWRELVSAIIRATLIVTVLLISIVGIPWGIRQLVRYQLVPQVVMLEGLGGAAAIRRSSELVRGRWWHLAVLVALLNVGTFVVATFVAMLLLIVLTFLPLWSFNVIAAVVFGLIVPFTAAAFALIYGDRVAAHTDSTAQDVQPVLLDSNTGA